MNFNKRHSETTENRQAPATDASKRPASGNSAGIGRAGIALIVVLLVLAVIAGVQWEQNSVVRSVKFYGFDFTTEEELVNALPFETGIQADSIDFMAVMEQVNRLPYIRSSKIHVEANGQMIINVKERKPLALLIDTEEQIYIDEDGIYMPVVLEKPVDVPLLYGFPAGASGDTVASTDFDHVRKFLLEAQKNPFASATISEVAWRADEGVVALSHENAVKLIFGSDDYETKLRSWKAFYSDVVSTNGIDSFAYVDFRFRNQIITQKI